MPFTGRDDPKPFPALPSAGGSKLLMVRAFGTLLRCFCLTPMCLEAHSGGGPPAFLAVPNTSCNKIGDKRVV